MADALQSAVRRLAFGESLSADESSDAFALIMSGEASAAQVAALLMLAVPAAWLILPWVMGAQALSCIAKDLNKMSAKSSVKLLVADGGQGRL